MCGAPEQSPTLPAGIDVEKETVIYGVVSKGEAPVAWVVARESDSISEEELKQWFLERGPAYAHPRRVFFLDELPVSGTNKLDRKRLEDDARRLIQSSEATRT